MREILFRGKRVDNGEWLYGSFIPDLCELLYGDKLDGFIKPFGKIRKERLMVEVDRKTVGQYTGLKDKNGMRIFENDIVQVKIEQTGVYFIGEITWYRGSLCIMFSSSHKVCDLYTVQTSNIEVIGNRFDNPELLEGKEDE